MVLHILKLFPELCLDVFFDKNQFSFPAILFMNSLFHSYEKMFLNDQNIYWFKTIQNGWCRSMKTTVIQLESSWLPAFQTMVISLVVLWKCQQQKFLSTFVRAKKSKIKFSGFTYGHLSRIASAYSFHKIQKLLKLTFLPMAKEMLIKERRQKQNQPTQCVRLFSLHPLYLHFF